MTKKTERSEHFVRIVRKRKLPPVAKLSLGAAAGVVVLVVLLWRLWHGNENTPVYERRPSEVEVDWRCGAGHRFSAALQLEPRRCWEVTCTERAYPVARYRCPRHGVYEVAFRFRLDEGGRVIPGSVTSLYKPLREYQPK